MGQASKETMTGIIFRKYRIGDEKGLTLLAKAVWGSNFNEDYWKWKYLKNPLRNNFSYVAECNDDMVGFVGGIPWRIIVAGKELLGGQVADMMVHPEWRKKGIFFPINRKNLEEIKTKTSIHYGFCDPASHRIYKKLFHYEGFHPLRMEKIMNVKAVAWQALKQKKVFDLSRLVKSVPKILSSKTFLSDKSDKSLRTNLVVKEIDRFDDRFDEFWERVHRKFNIATVRDSKYLNWRYIKHPAFRYTVFGAEEDGKLSGFVIVRCEKKDGIMKGFLIDLLIDPDREMTARILIGESLRFFRSKKVSTVIAWMFKNNPIYGILGQNGFSSKVVDQVVVQIKSFSQDFSTDYLKDTHNWYLTMGDCEVF